MYLGDQLAGVHLTLQQGTGETSAVDIRVDAGDEQLEAHLQVNGEHIEGYLVGNTPGRGYETGKDLRYIP